MAIYIVTVSHPTGFHSGDYVLTVRDNTSPKGTKYVAGSPFGCSRDYRTTSDNQAIEMLLAEHACRLVAIRPE